MELILNEKSLCGQFASADEFYDTLPMMSRNLGILRKLGITLLRHTDLYSRKITNNMILFDLQNRREKVEPGQRDKVRKWKRELSALISTPPFWNTENSESTDSVEEAARRRTDLLSFPCPVYQDKVLPISVAGEMVMVHSAVTTRYLMNVLRKRKMTDSCFYLKTRFGDGRIVLDCLDEGSVRALENSEFEELIAALERFDETVSWDQILSDNFFNYKSYQPPSKKKNVFAMTQLRDKRIDKFRCGKHSQIRCFGFREDTKFYVIMIERDHRISDTG